MVKCKIDVQKIDKNHLYKTEKGNYLSVLLMENKGGKSKYGDDGFIVQSVSKEAREAGERGPIIGNWQHIEGKKSAPKAKPSTNDDPDW
jgi:hypothetical protein